MLLVVFLFRVHHHQTGKLNLNTRVNIVQGVRTGVVPSRHCDRSHGKDISRKCFTVVVVCLLHKAYFMFRLRMVESSGVSLLDAHSRRRKLARNSKYNFREQIKTCFSNSFLERLHEWKGARS